MERSYLGILRRHEPAHAICQKAHEGTHRSPVSRVIVLRSQCLQVIKCYEGSSLAKYVEKFITSQLG